MANPVSDFMSNWLNTTYKYLKETGGPTYPKATVGPGVMPTGAYSTIEQYPIDYGYVPQPFNPGATGIPATTSSQVEVIVEEAKQNPPPTTFSKNFGLLYGVRSDAMSACIADQKHGHGNPNALNACRDLAERGDTSGVMLLQSQKDILGIKTVLQDENNKPDDVRLIENEESLTGQIGAGAKGGYEFMKNFLIPAGTRKPVTPMENPEGMNFQDLGKKAASFIPPIPGVPEINSSSLIMIGGAVVLVVLLIAIVK